MALTAVECPGGVCHSHHGGHAVEREQLRANLQAHGQDWCERLAERVYEISVDSLDRKSTRLNSSHVSESRMPSSA